MKNANTARHKGHDAGKNVPGSSGTSRVDTQGLPHAIHVTGGYTGEAFAAAVKATLGAEVEIARRAELHRFVVMPKRWVVERSFVAFVG